MADTAARKTSGVTAAVARSPIGAVGERIVVDGWERGTKRSTAALVLADASHHEKVCVRADADGALADTLGVSFRSASRQDGVLVIGSSPGEWLLVGKPGASRVRAEQAASAAAGDFVSIVDLTHGRALMRLTGRDAARALAKVCAIDLSDTATPSGTAFRTSVAKVATDVVRDDEGAASGEPSYLLHCERSSGQYLFDCLLDAGREFGVDTAGEAP